ncbi:MAG: glucosyl-3-phosphoglycerate synthase [Acidimicrobiia bacterium]
MDLRAVKRGSGFSISVCLPARNEESTVGVLVAEILNARGGSVGLVDEVVVIDDGSTDRTAEVAAAAGARVVREATILPDAGPGSGKGNALWKSLYECRGDLICWIDADLRNFRAEYLDRLVAPLLTQADVVFVKAYYDRSYAGEPTGGGRVTELVARPLLSLLFPKLADIVQPLGGEYAGRRETFEVLPFVEGWGVELGLLIDVVDRFGRDAVAQVDLGVREHRNRPLTDLSPQALAILATALRRAGFVESETAELLRYAPDGTLDALSVEVRERPPMITVQEYRVRHFDQ